QPNSLVWKSLSVEGARPQSAQESADRQTDSRPSQEDKPFPPSLQLGLELTGQKKNNAADGKAGKEPQHYASASPRQGPFKRFYRFDAKVHASISALCANPNDHQHACPEQMQPQDLIDERPKDCNEEEPTGRAREDLCDGTPEPRLQSI